MNEKGNLNRAMERLGEFGELFVDYEGCPRGPKGRAFVPLEQEVLAMSPITDVDGGVWIPVNEDALRELVADYIRLKKTAERDSDTAKKLVKMLEGCENVQLITAEASQNPVWGGGPGNGGIDLKKLTALCSVIGCEHGELITKALSSAEGGEQRDVIQNGPRAPQKALPGLQPHRDGKRAAG